MKHLVRLLTVSGLLLAPVQAFAQNGIVDLPAVFIDTTYPATSGTLTVCASGCTHTTLQAAVNAAVPGNVIELAPGSVHTGPITLRKKTNPNNLWIVIRSSSAAFNVGGSLAPETRVGPGDASSMAVIESPGGNGRAIQTETDASRYRLVGLEVRPHASETNLTQLIMLGNDTSPTPAATHITIDRCYVHGRASGNYRRGAAFNGAWLAAIDSYFSDFHYTDDSQAIAGWNGAGPFKIVNNYLEAASENVFFGGCCPAAAGLIPSDIEIRRNLMSKPLSWRGVHPVKNAFETKNARRLLVEGNIFENVWDSGQDGTAIVLKANNPNGSCTWCSTVDLTFRYNIVRHAAAAIKVLRDGTGSSGELGDFLIEHNLFEHIDYQELGPTGSNRAIMLNNQSGNLIFRNNTFLNDNADTDGTNGGSLLLMDTSTVITGFEFSRNLGRRNAFGIKGPNHEGILAMEEASSGTVFERNGIAGCSASLYDNATYDNQCPSYTTWEAQFVNYSGDGDGGDYHLVSPNIYRSQWNEDIGADIDAINDAIGGNLVHLSDDFNDNSLAASWNTNIFGFKDPNTPVNEANQRIEIGPLPLTAGAHWNGIQSVNTYNFTGSYIQARIGQAPPAAETLVFTMAGLYVDTNHFYRWVINSGDLIGQRNIGTGRVALVTLDFATLGHEWLRIRHDATAGLVVFETADNVNGQPGAWTQHYSEPWDTANVPLANLKFEIKAGADSPPSGSVLVAWDDFKAARP